MPAATPLFSLNDATITRQERRVLHGLSLCVASGQILHLHGANGIGKTSLLRFIANTCLKLEIKKVFIPSNTSFLKNQETVIENMSFWATDQNRIKTALHRFGMDALAERPLRLLSAGQRQRVNLCRLLLSDAALWLIDEPLNSLDDDGCALFFKTLITHQSMGGAALIASHVAIPGAEVLNLTPFAVANKDAA